MRPRSGYDGRDTATSLSMGLGSVVGLGCKVGALVVYAGAFALTPLRLDTGLGWVWVIIFFADDLAYYWYHRAHHEVRILWASHVVHHSSRHYNLSTALRQTWTPFGSLPFWLPMALLGVPPWAIFLQQSISLLYPFFLHTERVDKLPRVMEWVMNTPSHHRVHHGMNQAYLDRNYGGVLVIWDRLFRSFEAERERVVYGLTKQLRSHNPLVVATHEYRAIWQESDPSGAGPPASRSSCGPRLASVLTSRDQARVAARRVAAVWRRGACGGGVAARRVWLAARVAAVCGCACGED